jgi:ATP/maltotriose-dependent transcriptional regulator MalT
LSTVKTHVKNIYRKLGARNRAQAVSKARELNLL